ncbi:UNVERIFIED_CONTAM: hypothetical protein K2H54_014677 [Gekko kuhli]
MEDFLTTHCGHLTNLKPRGLTSHDCREAAASVRCREIERKSRGRHKDLASFISAGAVLAGVEREKQETEKTCT